MLTWGKRKGFLPEQCYPQTEGQGECPEDHMDNSECRQQNNLYKVVDFCVASEVDGIKREIMTHGPVLGQLNPYTDLLTYSEGVYSRSNDAFKFQGNHVVKIVGWESSVDGGDAWIVENTWGADWGENGYARIASGGETSLDFYAISFAMYPKTMAEYYAEQYQQQMQEQLSNINLQSGDQDNLDEEIEQIFLDEDGEQVIEEGIDAEL